MLGQPGKASVLLCAFIVSAAGAARVSVPIDRFGWPVDEATDDTGGPGRSLDGRAREWFLNKVDPAAALLVDNPLVSDLVPEQSVLRFEAHGPGDYVSIFGRGWSHGVVGQGQAATGAADGPDSTTAANQSHVLVSELAPRHVSYTMGLGQPQLWAEAASLFRRRDKLQAAAATAIPLQLLVGISDPSVAYDGRTTCWAIYTPPMDVIRRAMGRWTDVHPMVGLGSQVGWAWVPPVPYPGYCEAGEGGWDEFAIIHGTAVVNHVGLRLRWVKGRAAAQASSDGSELRGGAGAGAAVAYLASLSLGHRKAANATSDTVHSLDGPVDAVRISAGRSEVSARTKLSKHTYVFVPAEGVETDSAEGEER